MKRKKLTKGFCQDKKIQNARKTRKWVGGSNHNSDFIFFGNFVLICDVFMSPIVSKKMDRRVGGV